MTYEAQKVKYFAYGSDMLREHLEHRVGEVRDLGKAIIPKGYALDFSKKGTLVRSTPFGLATIRKVHEADREIQGVLYILSQGQSKKLDIYQGVPQHYHKCRVEVEHEDKFKLVNVYLGSSKSIGLQPQQDYLERMTRGAIQHELDKDYVEYLMRIGFIPRGKSKWIL